jgi:cytochrome c biogenesis protein CcmG/thiol:disulfide interchange protein DsbE
MPSLSKKRRGHSLFAIFTVGLLGLSAGIFHQAIAAEAPHPNLIDTDQLKKEIASRHGNVVVLNLWATWCPGCVQEFPDLVKAAQADRAKGVSLLTISFDDAHSIDKAVVPFLSKNHLSTGIFVNKKGSQPEDTLISFLEPKLPADDPFGIPRTYIFDRQGKLVKVLVGAQSYATFDKAIREIAKK